METATILKSHGPPEISSRLVLLVEDNPGDANLVREYLSEIPPIRYEVLHASTMKEAMELLQEHPIDAVLLDLRLPDAEGIDSVRSLRALGDQLPIVVLTGMDDDALAVSCLDAGAQDFLLKNEIRAQTLRRSIEYAISRLRESQLREIFNQQLSHIVATSPATLYTVAVDAGGVLRHEWVSDNVERLTGYHAIEVGQGWWADHIHPDDRERVLEGGQQLISEGSLKREYRVRRRDGSYLWIRDEQRLVRDPVGRPLQIVGSWFDITERREAEKERRESEERYRLLFDENPHPMWVFDPESSAFLVVNDTALTLFGYSREEMLAMSLEDICPSEGWSPPAGQPGLRRCRRKDGTMAELDLAIHPILRGGQSVRLVVGTDLSEHRRLELQLLQSQKMDAIGQLAGGVAHDFNNLLGVIIGYCEMLAEELSDDARALRRLEHISRAADRAAGLTRQLLAFGRKQVLQPKVIDLGDLVPEITTMLRRLIGENIDLDVRAVAQGTSRIFADPGQIEQVIINLAVNARDAMPDGGRLLLETSNVQLDSSAAWHKPAVPPGDYVLLAVSDTGCGMSSEVLAQIFEPFFTTKEAGKGTGLGLSTAYGIVKQSGGYVSVYSEPGRGSTFKVYLPRVDSELEPAPVVSTQPPQGGAETILLLEDSEALRLVLHEMLEDAGYQVIDGETVDEAMARALTHKGPLHLVLSDVVMPGASGPEVVARLKTQRPELRALFMSGYTDEAIGRHGILDRGTHFLQKPFTSKALRDKIREVIEGPA